MIEISALRALGSAALVSFELATVQALSSSQVQRQTLHGEDEVVIILHTEPMTESEHGQVIDIYTNTHEAQVSSGKNQQEAGNSADRHPAEVSAPERTSKPNSFLEDIMTMEPATVGLAAIVLFFSGLLKELLKEGGKDLGKGVPGIMKKFTQRLPNNDQGKGTGTKKLLNQSEQLSNEEKSPVIVNQAAIEHLKRRIREDPTFAAQIQALAAQLEVIQNETPD